MNNLPALVIGILIGAFAVWTIHPKRNQTGKDAANRVRQAFDGVDWSHITFNINGGPSLEAPGGEKFFYKAGEIDAAIKRLNEVLNELNKD